MADTRECPCCMTPNAVDRYFCSKCGSFLRKDELSNSYNCSEEEFKIQRIVSNIPQIPHEDIFWNKTADAYCRKIERLQALLDVSDENHDSYNKILNQMKEFLDECRNPEYQIAFVGTIKTGKSTLINALLGKNYASMAVTPETAALTKFRKSPKDYVNVVFYTDQEWRDLWNSMSSAADTFLNEYKALNAELHKAKWINHNAIHVELSNDEIQHELLKWSSSKSPEHYFVKEIEVGISTLPSGFPPEVVFVDTPGLLDPVAYRSNITKNYIKNANAVFVCINANTLNRDEIETIASVFSFSAHNKKKVHIVATHWDVMNDPINNWNDQKENYLKKQLVGKAFYDSISDAESNIMHSAAFIYNLCRDYKSLDKNERKSLMSFAIKMDFDIMELSEHLSDIIEMTNINQIRNIINDRLVSRYSELMLQDLTMKYKNILTMCKRYAENSKQDISKVVTAANCNLDALRKQLDQVVKDYKDIQKSKEMLYAALKTVKKKTDTRLNNILKQLEKVNG